MDDVLDDVAGSRHGRGFVRALAEVEILFADDRRKGKNEPYLAHLLSVSALVLQDGGTRAEVIAALLHDAMEDKGLSVDHIREIVGSPEGDVVADIVYGCSDGVKKDGTSDDGPRGPKTWHSRKRKYLEHLETADRCVLRVSLADKLDNARDLLADIEADGDAALRWFNSPPADQLWWYDSLDAVFAARALPNSRLSPRLHSAVSAINRLVDLPRATRIWTANENQRRRLQDSPT